MKTRWILGLVALSWIATACVTIHIHFPAAAAEQAADRIIDGVWGPDDRRREDAEPQARSPGAPVIRLAGQALSWLVPAAHAQQADIDISTPAIARLEAAMAARHRQLLPYYDAGAIGLSANGLIEIRDQNVVPLAERTALRRLVAEENADRNNLYREIAVANGNPQWEPQIRETFARRWIERARSGWYYRDARNDW
ncbi:MAG: DUF1318 domain-containing protein, partial [Gammaproteobacteria bacterium]